MVWAGPNSAGNEIASIDMGSLSSSQDDGNIIFKTSLNANDSEQNVHEYMHERMRIDPWGAVTMGSRMQEPYRLTLNVSGNDAAIKSGLLVTAATRDVTQNNHLIECRGRADIGSVFQVNSNGTVYASGGVISMGMNQSDVDDFKPSEIGGLEHINKIVVHDVKQDGKQKLGLFADDLQKAIPQSVVEHTEEEVVVEAQGNIVSAAGTEGEHIHSTDIKKSDFENPEHTWEDGAEFIETKAEETKEVTKLGVSNDQLVATLIKAVQELSAKNDELSAKVDELNK